LGWEVIDDIAGPENEIEEDWNWGIK